MKQHRTIRSIFIPVAAITFLGASGAAAAVAALSYSTPNTEDVSQSRSQPASHVSEQLAPDEAIEPEPATLPAQSASTSSSVTITVNGETTTASGPNTSLNRTYVSDNGSSQVHISVQNSQSLTSEDKMD